MSNELLPSPSNFFSEWGDWNRDRGGIGGSGTGMSAVLPSPLGGGGNRDGGGGGGSLGFSAFPMGTGLTPLDVKGGGWGRDGAGDTPVGPTSGPLKRKGDEEMPGVGGEGEEKKVKL
jgi:hypothetical protein